MDTISENDSTILILLPTNTYRATDLLNAAAAVAAKQALRVLVGCDRRQALEGETPESTVTLAFDEPEIAARQVEAIHRRHTIAAIVGLDDETTELAALASGMIGLRHNSVEAVRIANNKLAFRHAMQIAGLPAPRFWPVDMERLEPLDEFARLRIPHSIEDNPDVFDVLAREVSFRASSSQHSSRRHAALSAPTTQLHSAPPSRVSGDFSQKTPWLALGAGNTWRRRSGTRTCQRRPSCWRSTSMARNWRSTAC